MTLASSTSAAALDAGRGAVLALPHSGNWDMAGVWVAQTLRHPHHRRRTPAARVAVRPVHRLPGKPRASSCCRCTGGDRPPFEVLAERLRDNRLIVPDGRPRPDPQRRAGRLLRRAHPDARRAGDAGARNRRRAAARALLVRARTAGACESSRRWTRRPATSPPSPRRWPTGSPRNIAAHPADWHMLQPQWLADLSQERRAKLAGGLERSDPGMGGAADAHRDGLPVLVRRPRRRAVARAATRRGRCTARGHRRQRAGAGVTARRSFPDSWCPAASPCRSRTTARWPGCGSGPATHRKVKRWLTEGEFDVLHLHEPNAPSLSMLALMIAEGPIVATFHTSTTKSLTLSLFEGLLRPMHEKIVGRIAVSDLARRWQMEALGVRRREIPNGVDVASFASAPAAWRLSAARASRCCSSAASTNPARAWACCSARCRHWSSVFPTSRS